MTHSGFLDHRSDWVVFMPVRDLELFDAVNFEYRVDRITFIRTDKLALRRRRFGLPLRVSQLIQQFGTPLSRLLKENPTIAVARGHGSGEEVVSELLERARDELAVLSLSQLSYSRRRYNSCPVIAERHAGADLHSRLVVDCYTGRSQLSSSVRGKVSSLQLTQEWKEFQDQVFFSHLVEILRRERRVSSEWRRTLWNVAVLGGQSQGSTDKAQSFLWNIIALEALLAEHSDKKSDVLPSRIKAFIGWAQHWEGERFEERIDAVYKKRSALVHQGNREAVTMEDLLLTDDLLLNVLVNISRHPELFGSKQAIVEFSRKVEAERILGVRPIVQPKTLQMLRPKYDAEDFRDL